MPDRLSKLVNAINRVGVQNVALLARTTGIPAETVRYMLKKRFRELGLFVSLQVDYDRLGLERNFAVLEFPPDAMDYAAELLKRMAKVAFLTYHCREVLRPRYVATFGVPVSLKGQFLSFLNRLVNEKVLRNFKLERLDWTRHLALRSEYYDFNEKRWSIDWKRVGALQEPPPTPPLAVEPPTRPDLDETDILLVKELELRSWRRISEIARKVGMNDRTLRWHYTKHVSPMVTSQFVQRYTAGSKELTRTVGVIHEFNRLSKSKLVLVRRIFNNFPFTWNEGGRNDGYHLTVATIPSEYFIESMQFLTTQMQKEIGNWETYTLDLTQSQSYTIPYENFSDKAGWFFDSEKAMDVIIETKASKK